MRLNYTFSNLCGTVYRQGNLVFSPDGSTLYSAVGNRVACFDLIRSRSFTFPFEARRNISRLALSPDGAILLTIDDEGHLLMVNVHRRIAIHHLNLKQKVGDVRFSPDGKYVAFAIGRLTQVWATPALERSFVPFALHDTFGGHGDDVVRLEWSPDSLFIASGSRDTAVRVHPLHRIAGLQPCNLTGHRSALRGVFFADADAETLYAVSKEGALSVWELRDRPDADPAEVARQQAAAAAEPGGGGRGERAIGKWWELADRHYLSKGGARSGCRVSSCVYHAHTRMLVVGFGVGTFSLYEMPGFNEVHTLSISESRVDACAVAPTGDWLAFGCAQLGQLLVWEWQAETYVLKQQGHYFAEVGALAYSPGGNVVATGGGDGKVKLWSPSSGFCFVTFSEHAAPVTDVAFVPHGRALVSSSLDGTVRAFDTIRYRNFQTLVSPTPAQFTCVAVDQSGEIVAAGSRDTLLIYIWSLQVLLPLPCTPCPHPPGASAPPCRCSCPPLPSPPSGRCRRRSCSTRSRVTRRRSRASPSRAPPPATTSSRAARGTRRCACGTFYRPRAPSTRCAMAPTCSRSPSRPTARRSRRRRSTARSRCGTPRRPSRSPPSTAAATSSAAARRSPRSRARTTRAASASARSPSPPTARACSRAASPSTSASTTSASGRCCASTSSRPTSRSTASARSSTRRR